MVVQILQMAAFALWAGVLGYLIKHATVFQLQGISRGTLLLTFALKVTVGAVLAGIYMYYYPHGRVYADTFRYFDDARVVYDQLWKQPDVYVRFLFNVGLDDPQLVSVFDQMHNWTSNATYGLVNDSQTMVRLNMVLMLFTGGNYGVHLLFFNFLALLGWAALYRVVAPMVTQKAWLWWALVLTPTALFWGSGVLKEAPFIGLLGWMIYALFNLPQRLLQLVIACVLMVFLKPYVLFAMLPAITGVLLHKWVIKRVSLAFAAAAIVLGVAAFFADYFYSAGDLLYVLQKKQTDFVNVGNLAESAVIIEPIGTTAEFIASIPERVWYTYMRPNVFEADRLMEMLAAGENAAVFFLVAAAFIIGAWRKSYPPAAFSYFVWSAVVGVGVIVGSVVPVLGAVVRYKMPALILLVAWCAVTLFRGKNWVIKEF